MKRTKKINHAMFRKSWRLSCLTPVAIAITTVFMLSGCEQADETVSMYRNSDDCSQANPGKGEQCTTAYHHAEQEAAKTAPKFASREDCVAEFGENQCQQVPAQASVAATPSQSSTGIWMPMMAGYMMGRMMGGGGFTSQPLFTSNNPTSPASGKYVDASGRNYGAATPGRSVSVPKQALTPKPATTKTTVRGGFGETVTRHSLSSSSSQSHASSSSSHRSFGG